MEKVNKNTGKSTRLLMTGGITCQNSYVIKFKDKMLIRLSMEKSSV